MAQLVAGSTVGGVTIATTDDLGGGGGASAHIFNTSGTWTKPDGVNKVLVEVVGGGAGSGNASSNASNYYARTGGGGGGGYGAGVFDVTNVNSVAVTVGAGGGNAGNGGSSSFGSYITANGGTKSNSVNDSTSAGGAGGNASGGQIEVKGLSGGAASGYMGGNGGLSYLGMDPAVPGIANYTDNEGATAQGGSNGTPASSIGGGASGCATRIFSNRSGSYGQAGVVIVTGYSS